MSISPLHLKPSALADSHISQLGHKRFPYGDDDGSGGGDRAGVRVSEYGRCCVEEELPGRRA
jgi:hypothetical protein